jgi:hypothetical protein
MRFEALFALYPPLRIHSIFHHENFKRMVNYFDSNRTLNITADDSLGGDTLIVRAERCSPSLKRRFFRDKMYFNAGDWLLRFNGEFQFPGANSFY